MVWIIIGLLIVFYLAIVGLSIWRGSKKAKITTSFIISKFLWSVVILLAILYSLSILVPLFWMAYTAVKDSVDFAISTFALPTSVHFENFLIVLEKLKIREGLYEYDVLDMLFNSLVYSLVTPLVSIFWITIVAYVMGRFKFFGNKFLYSLGVILMMVPIVGSLSSEMIIKKAWGLYDNMYVSMLIPPSLSFSGIYFMMLYGVFKNIPLTYSEAAYIDGASELSVMFRIVMPMALPTCATLYILSFITAWNSYESFLIWYPSTPNLAYGMYRFQSASTAGAEGATVPQIMAGFIIAMIPSLILFLSSQKLIKSNFMVGGIKG